MTNDEALRVLERYGVYGCGVCLQDGIEHYQIENGSATLYLDAEEALKLAIDALKTEAEPVRHGHWKQWDEDDYGDTYECTSCGEAFVMLEGSPIENGYHYCPYCGAKMDERKEE